MKQTTLDSILRYADEIGVDVWVSLEHLDLGIAVLYLNGRKAKVEVYKTIIETWVKPQNFTFVYVKETWYDRFLRTF